ncbi:LolA family protein [Haladaptatus sp. DFWS20]|uniref:LolA family protein n=1 Tax=Haladaptatus sp. DFWS20 TaxID=3403467 RepID=UPI003EB974D0
MALKGTTAEDVVQKATESYKDIDSFKATVTSQSQSGELSTESQATLWYAKDGNYRIEYQKPESQDGNIMI